MNRRIRVTATVDRDSVSPDSIKAAHAFLTDLLFERAETIKVALDWNTYHAYSRRDRRGDLVIIAWVRVIR